MLKKLKSNRKYQIIAGATLLIVFAALLWVAFRPTGDDQNYENSTEITESEEVQVEQELEDESKTVEVPAPQPKPAPKPEPESTWPVVYSASEAASVTVVVNKKHRLPSDYAPALVGVAGGQMRSDAAAALSELLAAAQNAGNSMVIVSSYRSYQTQVSTYQYWVDMQGQAQADRESARPGHSEHQTGLAVDLGNPDGSCRLLACFGSGAAGQWLAAHAHEYGFIIRYPDGKEEITGYIYEPWHVRFMGKTVAAEIKSSGLTLDQFYGVEGGGYN